MKANQLQEGQRFMLPGQRKFKTARRIRQLPNREGIPEKHRGKTLIILEDCRQMVISPDTEIIIQP